MKKLHTNIIVDVLMLVAITITSFSGFVLDTLLPRGRGGMARYSSVMGMNRREWHDIHLIVGIILVVLLVLHIVLHWTMVDGYFRKQIKSAPLRYALYVLLAVMLALCVIPWIFTL